MADDEIDSLPPGPLAMCSDVVAMCSDLDLLGRQPGFLSVLAPESDGENSDLNPNAIKRDGFTLVYSQLKQYARPLTIPDAVSLKANINLGGSLKNSTPIEYVRSMWSLFHPSFPSFHLAGGEMDYQTKWSITGDYVKSLINAGNYNFGLVTAASGLSERSALGAASLFNWFGAGAKTDGPLGGNPRNDYWIHVGYEDYNKMCIPPPLEYHFFQQQDAFISAPFFVPRMMVP